MNNPLKYRALPSRQDIVTDETSLVVIALEVSITLIAHGHIVTTEAIYTLPEGERFSYAKSTDMEFFAVQVTKAQVATGLPEAANNAMDAKLIENGITPQ